MIKYSIITPVYNGEKYIATCIEKIASANYDKAYIEHIIVDDGSTDNTRSICETYAQKYSHIKFYSKQNGNWGSVINYVKNNKLATGDYIAICDADDVIMPNAFAHVNKRIDKINMHPDIFVGSFYLWNGKKRKNIVPSYYFLFKKVFTKQTAMNYFSPLILPFCTYIKNNIFYQLEDLKERIPYQDNILCVNAFLKSKNVAITAKAFSKYWKTRPGNTTTQAQTEAGIQKQLVNLEYYSKHNLIEPFAYQLFGLPKVKKYLKHNNITYNFENKKPDLTGFPWWARWAIKLMFITQIKKLIK